MKQFERAKYPKQQISWQTVVTGLHEASTLTQLPTARVNGVEYNFWPVNENKIRCSRFVNMDETSRRVLQRPKEIVGQ
jgi:hypothetical protein